MLPAMRAVREQPREQTSSRPAADAQAVKMRSQYSTSYTAVAQTKLHTHEGTHDRPTGKVSQRPTPFSVHKHVLLAEGKSSGKNHSGRRC